MSLAGLCSGMVMPSRDMIVREVTPPGSFGKVFAFVTTGYHIAGILAPLMFGALLDHGAAARDLLHRPRRSRCLRSARWRACRAAARPDA